MNNISDMAVPNLHKTNQDKVRAYQTEWCTSSNEATLKNYGFSIYKCHPAVQNFAIHFKIGQQDFFNAENA